MPSTVSLGTDIVDVARIRRLIRNKKFLARVFTADEVRYCKDKKNAAQHFAVRFAAKEAVWKALPPRAKTKSVGHKDIGVGRSDDGKPFVQLSPRLKKYERRFSLSLSHTRDYALATALYQDR